MRISRFVFSKEAGRFISLDEVDPFIQRPVYRQDATKGAAEQRPAPRYPLDTDKTRFK
jgi:hypothetical protein